MRAALAFVVLLPACLAVPADPNSQPAGGDAGGGADATVLPCASGSTLDLVYVDQIAVPLDGASSVALDGMAVFVNPGEDTLLLSGLSVTPIDDDTNVVTSVGINQDPAIVTLSPGEAKGAASPAAMPLMRATFDETWADTERPSLTLGFSLLDGEAFEGDGSIDVPLQVHAGDYVFPIAVTLVGDGSKELGAPVSAVRVSAPCE
jgi:hypothetical protein